ncbi:MULTISPECIES: heme-binding protein [unclassified Halanaerobium]|uniref:GlcG/HbpS family heme-binding protein n=1 Tax=unclassified Halanaerobium TaxID=2641197 RepID=UPI000DF33925|nr:MULTISPECIES: heme-binding protein [unclassified Halanaerobium]RCW45659.1 uncharacterized protein GlcG (DUF336 family) [Halanaerobium sp. MA284_MarDTE_T2]RCW88031.1 uncharacterized protein GlcG (DUF336 family) [Halanaerobium sp. DL-01]
MKISLNIAEKIAEQCQKKAEKMNLAAVISVVGDDGKLITFKKMDNALPISIELAPAKAYTAYALRMTTQELGEISSPGNMLYGIDTSCENIVLFGGGIPLKSQGEVVGAVGVSGGTVDEDIEIAESGAEFFVNRYTSS